MCARLNCSAYKHKKASDKYTNATTVSVGEETAEGKRGNLTEVVDDENDTGTRSLTRKIERLLVSLHSIDRAHERRVEAIER